MKVLAVFNLKGGVGKTAAAVNLSYLSTRDGARTLLWDLDPQGAASFYFRIKPKQGGGARRLVKGKQDLLPLLRETDFPGLDVLRARFSFRNLDLVLAETAKPTKRLARLVEPLASHYEYLFFDCAPGIGLTAESVFFAADALLVPTVPTPLSMRALEQLDRHLDRLDATRPLLLPFLSLVDVRRALHREICEHARDLPYGFLPSAIPYASEVERMGLHRAPLPTYARTARCTKAFESLWREVLDAIGDRTDDADNRAAALERAGQD